MTTQRITDDNIVSANDNATTRLSDAPGGSTSRINDDAIIGSSTSISTVSAPQTNLSNGTAIILNNKQYIIVKHITSSGEAEIYLMASDQEQVVLKYYFSNYKPKDEIIVRLHALKRRDIMSPLDSGVYQGRFFEITEYMSGGTMDAIMPLKDLALIRKYVAMISEALKTCHDNGIIHRDIKPVNIFFRSEARDEIALGDFGISSALQAGADYRFTNSVNRTTAYAAPELFTNINNQTTLDKKVDYYALGISFLELWLAADPFKDMAEFMAMRIKIEGRVAIPTEMDSNIKNLIKGLIATEPPTRWGYEEVQKWIAGEYVKVHETSAQKTFEPYEWDGLNNVVVTDPIELAGLMDADRKKAVRQLYSRSIPDWVKNNSQDMYSELLYIVEKEFPNNTPENADAGVTKAIYTLDRERSFKGFDGTICNSISEIARHIDANFGHYLSALKDQSANLYLFFETRGFDDRKKKYLKYFSQYSAKKALNLVILDLDDNNLVLAGKTYDNVQTLAKGDDHTLSRLIKQLADTESRVSLWLAITYSNLQNNIKTWRNNEEWQNAVTLGYALNTSGFKLREKEATDAIGFYTLLLNNADEIIEDKNTSLLADYWLRNYQNSSLYAQLIKLLAEREFTGTQLKSIFNLMLTLPEGQTLDVLSTTEFLKNIAAINTSDKHALCNMCIQAFTKICEQDADTMVYKLDALETIPALAQKINNFDKEYSNILLSAFSNVITDYVTVDLKKMQNNSKTFFAYYDRLTNFYLQQLKPLAPDMAALSDFESKKSIIDKKSQDITAKYDQEETGDKKTLEKDFSKYKKDNEKILFNYQELFQEYTLIFWVTSSLIVLYLIEVFEVIVFRETSWLMGFFISILMSAFIGALTALVYYVLGWFQLRGKMGKLLVRPIMKDPNSRMHKALELQQDTINHEQEHKMNDLNKRNDARINSDIFDISIKIMLEPAKL